jgi:hypothetical protein
VFGIALAAALALTPTPLVMAPTPTEPAPADVTVAWTSSAHDGVVVTWTESGDFRDRIEVLPVDGSPTYRTPTFVAAGQPNRVPLPDSDHGKDSKVVVTAVDAAGNPLSEPGSSPVFDMDPSPRPVLKAVVPREDGTVRMSWSAGVATDDTPGDPLDYDAPARFVPIAADPTFNAAGPLAPASAATSFTVPATQGYPTYVGVRTEETFWGWTAAAVEVNGTRLTVSIPGSAKAGSKLRATGSALRLRRVCDPGPCWAEILPDAGRELTLQARPRAGAAWTSLATIKANSTGGFSFLFTFPGTRDYRVVAAPVSYPSRATAGVWAATPVTTIRLLPAGAPNGNGSGGSGGSADTPGLPITGASVIGLSAAGGVLILLGVVLSVAGRARRRLPGR